MYRHIGLNVPFLELFGTHANHNAENEEEINEDKTASVADDDQVPCLYDAKPLEIKTFVLFNLTCRRIWYF